MDFRPCGKQDPASPQAGATLLEVLISAAIFVVVAVAIAMGLLRNIQNTQAAKDKAFAAGKVIQMMEELRSLTVRSGAVAGVLDDYDDGSAVDNPILTTNKDVTDPADPLSGNARRRYARQVSVIHLANQPLIRRVTVRVFLASASGPQLLAETYSVLRTFQVEYRPTQVYDVYFLSLENIPGWWTALSSLKPSMDNAMNDLQTRNPGVEFRPHWITQLAFGRDPYYAPYVNDATFTDQTAPAGIYFYPGKMHKPDNSTFFYYAPSAINGRINLDGTIQGGYSMADQWNHAVRYPDEERLYQEAVSAATSAGRPAPEITWRMLLEKMNSSPDEFRNILLVNLHGEMLPMPPMRNYSDAAKDPNGFPNFRAVTHPERIAHDPTDDISLRVYAYVSSGTVDSTPETSQIPAITIYIPSFIDPSYWPSLPLGSIRKLVGNSSAQYYSWNDAIVGVDYLISNPDTSSTLITLYNTPVRQAYNAAQQGGLPSGARLYGMEYIPCNVFNSAGFSEGTGDLTVLNSAAPKNTARWTINFPAGAFPSNQQYTFETRIGTDLTTGLTTGSPDQLSNLSRTYIWVGVPPPVTENYQFLGDPRHMPYVDVKGSDGYNWWFRDLTSSGYDMSASGFDRATRNGWRSTWDGWRVPWDVPRFHQTLRSGLLRTGGLWAMMSGWSFFQMGIGGEMGDDGPLGFPSGIPVMDILWNPSASPTDVGYVNEVNTDGDSSPSPTRRRQRLIRRVDGSWTSLPWVGELYPDNDFSTWSTTGNLPTGPSSNYYRALYMDAPYPVMGYNPVAGTSREGVVSFINGNPSGDNGSVFTHGFGDSGNLTSTGTTVSTVFNTPLPDPISVDNKERPFNLSASGPFSQGWNDVVYSGQRTTTRLLEAYYDSNQGASWSTSGLVSLSTGSPLSQSAYVIVNGMAPQDQFGTQDIGKLAMINMLRGYMQAGNPGLVTVGRLTQVPLVSISTPAVGLELTNPASIEIVWSSNTWVRWDLQPYTETYPAGFAETVATICNVKYSRDSGKTWFFADDDSAAQAGVLNAAYSNAPPYTWNTPASSFPQGTYLIRVEEYRANFPLHYAYHQREVYIQR